MHSSVYMSVPITQLTPLIPHLIKINFVLYDCDCISPLQISSEISQKEKYIRIIFKNLFII